jgi:hypothetical protein
MSLLNPLKQLGPALPAVLVLAAALAARGQTGAPASTASAPLALKAAVQPGEIIGNEQVLRQFITCGTNRFMFVLPPGLRNETQSLNSILLSSRDSRFYVTVGVFDAGEDDLASAEIEVKGKQVPNRFPGAAKVEQFTTTVAGREAKGVQLRQPVPQVGERFVRIVLVAISGTIVEFTLNSATNSSAQAIQTLDKILVTFRASENGRIEIPRMTDKS